MTKIGKKNLIIAFISTLTLIMLTVVSACSTKSNVIEVEDAQNNVQTFETKISHVFATQNPILNHVIAIGGGDKYLCGFSDNGLSDNLYKEIVPNWQNLKSIWKGDEFDISSIKTSNPDLALIAESQISKFKTKIETANIKTFIATPAKDSTSSVTESIARIGKILGAESRVQKLNQVYDEILNNANYAVKNCKDEHTVLFMGADQNKVVGKNLIQDEIIEKAHGINAVKDYANKHNDFDIEQEGFLEVDDDLIAKINPEMILIPAYANFTVEDVLNNPKLANTSAVKNKYVYVFPSKLEPWDYPTLASCLGIAYSIYCIHPDLYSKDKFVSDCNKFYKALYDKTFTIEQLGL